MDRIDLPNRAMGVIMRILVTLALFASPIAMPSAVLAHGGGLNAEGCHNDRKNGGYHCHGGGSAAQQPAKRQSVMSGGSSGRAFANCTAARAAGAAPVRQGDPGYGRHLDRDGDGIGCE